MSLGVLRLFYRILAAVEDVHSSAGAYVVPRDRLI